ncbi:hypothetical protein chiPu_0003661 [Chiloscyllium punctatum]|uniref:Uncharacterized protein n=1 Tax=Chiloscyllium punctatum TaxID=137246 RepID=A0A401S4B4_CHIPU|nr:hypothetical protein [Chiloscyllium punctatum]
MCSTRGTLGHVVIPSEKPRHGLQLPVYHAANVVSVGGFGRKESAGRGWVVLVMSAEVGDYLILMALHNNHFCFEFRAPSSVRFKGAINVHS